MFILTKLSDTVPIVPADFEKRTRQALEDNLNEKFANKVIQKVGLCICVYDIIKSSDGLIDARTSDGTVHVNVTFRLIVFRPFKGEVIHGKIRACWEEGVEISLSFFDHIKAPQNNLFNPSHYEMIGAEPTFIWTNDGQRLYFDVGEQVRFKVEQEIWQDQGLNTQRQEQLESGVAKAQQGTARNDEKAKELTAKEMELIKANQAPWRLLVSMQQPGLGLLVWW